ncbi:transposase [Kitasatospora sp. NPDC001664]
MSADTYATILVDMTTRHPVDILADRATSTFATWLRDHPEVRVVCRDRAGSFREWAQAGAPRAVQVADAWHLLNNLAQAVERVIGRHRVDLREPLTSHGEGPHRHGRAMWWARPDPPESMTGQSLDSASRDGAGRSLPDSPTIPAQ